MYVSPCCFSPTLSLSPDEVGGGGGVREGGEYSHSSSIFIVYLAPTYRAAEKSAREKVTSTTLL